MTKKKTTTTTRKRTTGRKTKEQKLQEELLRQQEEERKQIITIIVISALTIIGYMKWGFVGIILSNLQRFLFGRFYYVMMALVVVQILITIINRRSGNTTSKNPFALVMILAGILMICAYADTSHELKGFEILTSYLENFDSYFSMSSPAESVGGGLLGALLMSVSTMLVDWRGSILIVIVLFVIALVLLVNLKVYKQFFHTLREFFRVDHEKDDDDEEEEEEYIEPEPVKPLPVKETPKKLSMINVDHTRELETIQTDAPKEETRWREPEMNDDLVIIDLKKLPKAEPTKEPEESRPIFMSVDDLLDRRKSVLSESREAEEIDEEYVDDTLDDTEIEPVYHEISHGRPEPLPLKEEEAEEEYDSYTQPSYEPEPEPEPVVEPVVVSEEPIVKQPETPKTNTELPPSQRTRTNKPYQLPRSALLDPIPPKPAEDVNEKAADEKGELLVQVLRNFDIDSHLIGRHIGPSVTQFELRPEANVKISKILNLADNIKMQLAVRDVRIEAPIPGMNAVGIEIPNVKPVAVKMKELITKIPEGDKNRKLLIVLGKDLMGNVVTCRLDKMPHLLIAGATGSGKSVCMNSIITSLLLRTKPDEVKLLLIDPKKVEFTPYRQIPHLIGPVINDSTQANNALKVIVKIMEDRYQAFADAGVRNMEVFNEKVETMPAPADGSPKPKKMPYIVVIIDELADLMTVAGKDVEQSIQRITQMARAAGIHLIVATQRPSVDVITGVIKANIPSRIAFSVSSSVDSRTILDHVGAERLLGNGDMLYMPIGDSNATRVQGVFVTDDEVKRISDFCSAQMAPFYDDAFVRLDEAGVGTEGGGLVGADGDPLFNEIRDYVIEVQKASTSLLQRRFGIGYNRAARMIDLLEEQGIIGPAQGSKPRDVYIKKPE